MQTNGCPQTIQSWNWLQLTHTNECTYRLQNSTQFEPVLSCSLLKYTGSFASASQYSTSICMGALYWNQKPMYEASAAQLVISVPSALERNSTQRKPFAEREHIILTVSCISWEALSVTSFSYFTMVEIFNKSLRDFGVSSTFPAKKIQAAATVFGGFVLINRHEFKRNAHASRRCSSPQSVSSRNGDRTQLRSRSWVVDCSCKKKSTHGSNSVHFQTHADVFEKLTILPPQRPLYVCTHGSRTTSGFLEHSTAKFRSHSSVRCSTPQPLRQFPRATQTRMHPRSFVE